MVAGSVADVIGFNERKSRMRRVAIVVTAVVIALGPAGIAAADPPPNSILETAKRGATEAALGVRAEGGELALQASSRQRRRAIGRTVGGILLMGVGTPFLIAGLAAEDAGGSVCVGDDCITVAVDAGGAGYGVAAMGGAMVVSGVLLATIWSDVPVVNSLDFTVTPHRVQFGKTFGF